jgi:antitoxin ParD1/3/4
MHVSLTPELERRIKSKVDSGLYNNASEVVRESLRLMVERDDLRNRLRAEIQIGSEQLRRGEGVAVGSEEEFQSLARAGR